MGSDNFDFDFVISYAGEDEVFARQLATLLSIEKAKVFYAPDNIAEFWGKNLYEYLADIYSHKGRFCILLISPAYVEKNGHVMSGKMLKSGRFKTQILNIFSRYV